MRTPVTLGFRGKLLEKKMPRPPSYKEQPHERCCGNCRFAHLVAYKLDLLCFHGDNVEVTGQSKYPVNADYVLLDGEEVGLMEGDEYSRVWAGRIVESDDICDDWKPEA